jgi:hypothetical protein
VRTTKSALKINASQAVDNSTKNVMKTKVALLYLRMKVASASRPAMATMTATTTKSVPMTSAKSAAAR